MRGDVNALSCRCAPNQAARRYNFLRLSPGIKRMHRNEFFALVLAVVGICAVSGCLHATGAHEPRAPQIAAPPAALHPAATFSVPDAALPESLVVIAYGDI